MSNNHSNQSSYCQPCNETLGPHNLADEHYSSRAHLNRLLQLGIEIPLIKIENFNNHLEHSDRPLAKMPKCTICDTSVGATPSEAALHFRSREHLNKRLQRGLPVAAVAVAQPTAEADTSQRNHINQFLRQGLSQKVSMSQMRPAGCTSPMRQASSGQLKVINGKRKLPGPSMCNFGPHSSAMVSQFAGFPQEKRACRPSSSLQKSLQGTWESIKRGGVNAPPHFHSMSEDRQLLYQHFGSLQLSSYDHFGNLSAPQGGNVYRPLGIRTPQGPVTQPTRPIVPSNQWNSTQFGGFDAIQQPTMTPPRASWMYNELHSGNDYLDQNPSLLYNNQATVQSALYDPQDSMLYGSSQNTVMNDAWFCDLCRIPLPSTKALNKHVMSAEHQSEMRAQNLAMYQ